MEELLSYNLAQLLLSKFSSVLSPLFLILLVSFQHGHHEQSFQGRVSQPYRYDNIDMKIQIQKT